MHTRLTEMLGIEHPVMLAGMGGVSYHAIVAAVSEAGGFGTLGAATMASDELDREMAAVRSATRKPFGVDLLAALPERMLDDAHKVVTGGASLFVAGLGVPRDVVKILHDGNVLVASMCGKVRHAIAAVEAGCDFVIAQGTEAGGHTGTIATMVLTPEIVDIAGGRPVLAAGGIASGRQMAAALALGAAGVWCGSVWLSSEEDVANQAIKAKFLGATSSDTVRSRTRTGKPARQLRSAWHEEWEQPGSPAPLPLPLQPLLVNEAWQRIDAAAAAGHEGALRLESFFVGQVVGSFEQIRPAGEITRQIVADCEQRITELGALS